MMRINVLLLGLILFCGCSNKKSAGIRLRLNYPDNFQQVIVSHIITSGSATANLDNIIELKLELDSVINTETYLFTARVLRMRSKMESSEGTETYDSEKESSFPAFDRILRSPLSIRINRKGEVVQSFQFAGSEENAGDIIDMSKIQIVFPDRELKVGDTWKNENSNSLISAFTQTTFKLKEVTDSDVKIGVEADIKDGTGLLGHKKLRGEYRLDRRTNRLLDAKLESDLSTGGRFVYEMYEKKQ